MVEFQLDYFDKNPLESHRNEDGHIQFKNTGDDLIDKWEEQVARGDTPTMSQDMFDDAALATLERLRARGRSRTSSGGSFMAVHDEVARDARQQGLGVPTQGMPQFYRSNFGDGTKK
jgi:hypothetical protein